ncbi:MAG: gamma-glutamyltransferase [Pseudomonadota bacterium]
MSARAGIAAGHKLTAQAGAEVLAEGGSAADAAVASIFTACVCEPVLASPAGGGFAMVAGTTKPACLDFFVHTPCFPQGKRHEGLAEVEADFGGVTQAFHIGPGSVATPGLLPGLFQLHDRYGRLPMTRLAEYAIEHAKNGFPISTFQARLAQIVSPILLATPEARTLHAPEGALRSADAVFTNPPLADALDALANEGLRIATEGEIAQAMLSASAGGHLTGEDLKAYQPVWREPLIRSVGGKRASADASAGGGPSWQVSLNPSPSAGGGLISAILASYSGGSSFNPLGFARGMDLVDRRWRALGKPSGFDERMLLADPAPVAVKGTTHVSVIDKDGMSVALTVSNGEGNGAIVPNCGFMLNNMLGEDDLLQDGPGSWTPDTRLASMMAPTVAANEKGGLLAAGSGGSNRIRSAMANVLIRRLVCQQPLEEAIRAPRLHVEAGHLDVEPGFDPEPLQQAFDDHRLWDAPSMFFGGVHGVERVVNSNGRFSIEGAGDDRREGVFVTV